MYILDRQEQSDMLARLVEAGAIDGGWTRLFIAPETNERWALYHPCSEQHGGGPRFLRCGSVPEDVVEWATSLLRDGSEADVTGAGTDLSAKPEKWSALLDRIDAEYERLRPARIREFLNQLGVLHPMNRRSLIGKPSAEIAADAAHFKELAHRAAALIGDHEL